MSLIPPSAQHAPFYVYRAVDLSAPILGPFTEDHAALTAMRRHSLHHADDVFVTYGTTDNPEYERLFAHRQPLTDKEIRQVALMRVWGEGHDEKDVTDFSALLFAILRMSPAEQRAELEAQRPFYAARLGFVIVPTVAPTREQEIFAERERRVFWVMDDGNVSYHDGWSTHTPGYWWIPNKGFSGMIGAQLFATQAEANAAAITWIDQQIAALQKKRATLTRKGDSHDGQ